MEKATFDKWNKSNLNFTFISQYYDDTCPTLQGRDILPIKKKLNIQLNLLKLSSTFTNLLTERLTFR